MIKIFSSVVCLLFFVQASHAQNVGIGTTTPNTRAMLDITSADKGVMWPRISRADRRNMVSPAQGLILFDTTVNSLFHYTGLHWVQHTDSNNYVWKQNGPAIIYAINGTKVGINTIPASTLHINDINTAQLRFQNLFTGNTATDGLVTGLSSAGNMEFRLYEAGKSINLSASGLANDMVINNTGVAIGSTTAPPSAFAINNLSSAQKIILKNNNATQGFGMGVYNNALQIHAADATSKIQIGYGRAPSNFTSLMELQGSGVVDVRVAVTRPAVTGSADLIPIAYGRVNNNGQRVSGAGNWTASYSVALSEFQLEFPDEDFTSISNCIIQVSALSEAGDYTSGVHVKVRKRNVGYGVKIGNEIINVTNPDCGACIIWGYNREEYVERSAGFSFLVYKIQ